jgi:hypothetical protein
MKLIVSSRDRQQYEKWNTKEVNNIAWNVTPHSLVRL